MKKNTILIVDDSFADRMLLKKILIKKGGYDVLEADGNLQCIEMIKSQEIELVLMDVVMPGKFGNEILLDIREQFNPIELPIIMVTSNSQASDVIKCLQNGANDYITKPLNFEIALTRIKTHIMLGEVSREMSRLKQMETLSAMTVTYNHEINNALTIALSYLKGSLLEDAESVKKLRSVLWRIADIMKAIQKAVQKDEVDFELYAGSTKMVKIK